jgi:predicted amidohydrolase YtcJ
MDLVLPNIPAPGREEVKDMIRSACAALNAYGITSCQSDDYCVFHNLPWQEVNAAFRELEEAGELTVRVYEQANFTTLNTLQEFAESGNTTGAGSDYFRMGPLKMLGDGALGARTAYLKRPYADAPETKGLSVFSQETFDELIGYANRNGMQTAIHCIGDGCLDMVLSAMEKALKEHPRQDHRHGIVHCQITRPDQLKKLADLGLHIYAQSIFLDYDMHMVEDRVGPELARSSYSWKTLKNTGCTVSNGSDCPVELPDVLAGIQCAVTRRDLMGWGPYLEDQAFTIQEALDSFTKDAAYASFEECLKGQILPGMVADFVILGEDPFETPLMKLKDIPVLQTFLAGKKVYQA